MRWGLALAVVLAAGTVVGMTSAAPPLTAPWVDLNSDYQARVVGQRGIGIDQAVNAADVNGDGIPDALVSAPGTRSIVYVVYGRRGWKQTVPVASLPASQGYRLVTDADISGDMPVANAGDVNGDGVPDQLVGVSNGAGTVYVVYGQRGSVAPTIDLDNLAAGQGYRITGAPGDGAGTDVAGAGDVNGDGVPDQVIGASQAFQAPGRAYVVYGRRPGANINLAGLPANRGYHIQGADGNEAGNSVANAGDVNGDGVPDQLVGAMTSDFAYLVYGQRTASPKTIFVGLPGTWGYGMHGVPITLTGSSVANAGDVNGDGIPDGLIGASCEADGPRAANIYIVYGERTPPQGYLELPRLGGAQGYSITDSRGQCAGTSVAGMPDMNGDGVPDQLIGAFGAPVAGGAGAAYLVYGQRGSPQRVDLASLQKSQGYGIGGIPQAEAGWFVADAGDLNADGVDEAWVWAPNFSPTPTSTGADFLVGTPQPRATAVSSAARLRRGRVTIRIACGALPSARCAGTITLRKAGERSPVYGSARFSVPPNATTGVAVTLKRGTVQRFRKVHRLAADALVLTRRSAPATALSLKRRIELRRG